MLSALEHPEVVQKYLQEECQMGRVLGPFDLGELPGVHVSKFGVIPKSNQPGKWRLILDLSSPNGASVNDGIQKELCSLQYMHWETGHDGPTWDHSGFGYHGSGKVVEQQIAVNELVSVVIAAVVWGK